MTRKKLPLDGISSFAFLNHRWLTLWRIQTRVMGAIICKIKEQHLEAIVYYITCTWTVLCETDAGF
jgi:hypothetical protein